MYYLVSPSHFAMMRAGAPAIIKDKGITHHRDLSRSSDPFKGTHTRSDLKEEEVEKKED